MSTDKNFDRICIFGLIAALVIALLFMSGETLGIETADRIMGYEDRLFDTSSVHTLDIVMDDWGEFIENCEDEEYVACTVVIDGERYKNVAIRAKGNTSLSSVSQMGSERYSFKLEFDHYDSAETYHGLDKLNLNNLIQDNTFMKDYLTYRMMEQFGVDAPLCSFVYITVNGEDWGLYLAVEGVEESFLQRNYGSGYGDLYKPDSISIMGGNNDFSASGEMPSFADMDFSAVFSSGEMPSFGALFSSGEMTSAEMPSSGEMDFGGFGGMGSSDVKLQYIDDDPDSYSTIFSCAKTTVTEADKTRLIASLKSLSDYENLEEILDTDEVMRYLIVHNFVVNGDSYTGSLIHNYYLYEEDGQLSMIPWDYNLAFGAFGGMASSAVNDPIDEVLDDRPMQAWMFSDESYTEAYHALYAEFLETVDMQGIIESACALIAPYVEKDPTKFCTCEEFEAGVEALTSFCALRTESIRGQLDGSIPSTSDGQSENSSALVDAGDLSLSALGTMGGASGEWAGAEPGASLEETASNEAGQ